MLYSKLKLIGKLNMYRLLRFLGCQNWLRFGIRDRIIRFFCSPDSASSFEFVTNFLGLKFKGNLNSFIDWSVFFYGAYERENLLFLRELVCNKSNPVFVDVGANVGVHSLFMSQFCSEVHSFEPNPTVRNKLEEKIKINTISNIIIHDVGLGSNNQALPYFESKGNNQGTGSFVEGYSQNNQEKSIQLMVVCGDDYFKKFDLKAIDLVKIDVEGFEKNVLIGLRETIKKYRPIIFLEYSKATRESFICLNDFMELLPDGYEVMKVSCNNPCCWLFNSPKCKLVNFDFEMSGGDILIFPSRH